MNGENWTGCPMRAGGVRNDCYENTFPYVLFFGGGTDMESFFREHGGAVLSTTFDKY